MTEQMRKIDIVLYVLKKGLFLIENEFHLIKKYLLEK